MMGVPDGIKRPVRVDRSGPTVLATHVGIVETVGRSCNLAQVRYVGPWRPRYAYLFGPELPAEGLDPGDIGVLRRVRCRDGGRLSGYRFERIGHVSITVTDEEIDRIMSDTADEFVRLVQSDREAGRLLTAVLRESIARAVAEKRGVRVDV